MCMLLHVFEWQTIADLNACNGTAEEVQDASKVMPRVITWSVIMNVSMTIALNAVYVRTIKNMAPHASSSLMLTLHGSPRSRPLATLMPFLQRQLAYPSSKFSSMLPATTPLLTL